jgi:hypothetical protein
LAAIQTFLSNEAAVNALAKELGVDENAPPFLPPLPLAESPKETYPRSPGLAPRISVAVVVFLVVGGLVALFLIFLPDRKGGSGAGQTGANGPTGQTTSGAQAIPVSITDPRKETPPAQVARDITVAGPGATEPPGYHRWIFVHADDGRYYPQGGTESHGNGSWAIPGVTIGASSSEDVGHKFIVYVLQVDDSTDNQIRQFMSQYPQGYAAYSEDDWTSKFLRFKVDEVTVERTGCPCPAATS